MIIKIIAVAVKCCWRLVADCQPGKQLTNRWLEPTFVADCCFDLLACWSSIVYCCFCFDCVRPVQLVNQHALSKKEPLRNFNTVATFPTTRHERWWRQSLGNFRVVARFYLIHWNCCKIYTYTYFFSFQATSIQQFIAEFGKN